MTAFPLQSLCQRKKLDDWSPAEHLNGLTTVESHLLLDTNYFDCCQGTGVQVLHSAQSAAAVCQVSLRFRLVQHFLNSWGHDQIHADALRMTFDLSGISIPVTQSTRQTSETPVKSKSRSHKKNIASKAFLSEISDLRDQLAWGPCAAEPKLTMIQRSKGILLRRDSSDAEKLSVLCGTLLSFAWHEGILVFCVNAATQRVMTSSWIKAVQNFPQVQREVLVFNLDSLWDPKRAAQLEELIYFCRLTGTPLTVMTREKEAHANAQGVEVNSSRKKSPFAQALLERAKKAESEVVMKDPLLLARLREVTEIPD